MNSWITITVLFAFTRAITADLCTFDTRGQFYCDGGCCETECCEDITYKLRYTIIGVPWMLLILLIILCLGLHVCTHDDAEKAYIRGVKDVFVLNQNAIARNYSYGEPVVL